MGCYEISKNKNNQNNISNNISNILKNIKSNYILSKIYDNIQKRKYLEIVKYNKKIQNRLNLSIKDYEIFTPIEIEIIPCKKKYGKFINIKENDKSYYHIYFNDDKEEIKNKYKINKEDKITKIKLKINNQDK